ncbi:MAG: DUF1573 domain-containing protein, partial [Flavobacteriaceae bacterium]
MKKLGLLLVAVVFGATVYGQSGPKIEFKTETIDYGTVKKADDNGIRLFEFTNTGDAPLVITDVKTTCGCTVPSKPKEPIMPGKTGEIQVKYNMNPGNFSKGITVMSNAVNVKDGSTQLRIKGNVLAPDGTTQAPKTSTMEKKKALPQS